jgi:rSAM/selenodomain-associated transferase 2
MRLSVIVPALDEEATIASTLAHARRPGHVELVVVDGGSRDGTVDTARPLADRVLDAPRGRAAQMNAGAAAARGALLLFLHADTRLPDDYPALVADALAPADVVGGRFDIRLDAPGLVYRMIERLIGLRSRLTGVATGDQAIFVRRDAFVRVGGYPAIPLMEDIALCRALKRTGRMVALRDVVVTSARRWQRDGLVRTVALMWMLRLAYYAGVSPARLARAYRDAR